MVESTDEQAANCIAWVSHISDFEPRLFRRLYGRAFQDIVQSLLPGLRPYEGNVQSGNRLRAAIVFAVLEALWMASPNGVASVQPGGCLWPRLYRGASTAGLLMLEVLAQKVCVYRRNYPSRFDIEAWTRLVNRVQHLQELLEGVNELIRGDWDQPVAASPSETS
ncbi:hypothetical protein QFC21_001145 [Naganishia friedmannii]|uniref:Uncharacterized protein n=1 Tax=Naganishia friedmannii TaxID=89922 RepID=A0ACC2W9B2_9TREE|nr:hypothetical protein QFC21_001145 [Naganishia friedmannii]